MRKFNTTDIPMTDRIKRLIENTFAKMPEIEADRAVLITESYKQTENMPIVKRRALAFEHILENIPITIREYELIVGSATKAREAVRCFRSIHMNGLNRNLTQ